MVCTSGHRYPIVSDIPVLLSVNRPQTSFWGELSLKMAREEISSEQAAHYRSMLREYTAHGILRYVSCILAATNGVAYRHLVESGELREYPIPEIRLPKSNGELMLDIGCNWGRWCIAGARKGYLPVGIDPSLESILAAQAVSRQLGIDAAFVVADGRLMPFSDSIFDVVWSYSVIQHFSPDDAVATISEVGRVLKPCGRSIIEMPNRFGLRCLYRQAQRRFRTPKDFEVRYWTIPSLLKLFLKRIGETTISVDAYGSIGLQVCDARFMPPLTRGVIAVSELLRRASDHVGLLKYVADSVYLNSTKTGPVIVSAESRTAPPGISLLGIDSRHDLQR